nr:MAG TPA: hypothetical protein [Caudoviricetes sp.]
MLCFVKSKLEIKICCFNIYHILFAFYAQNK